MMLIMLLILFPASSFAESNVGRPFDIEWEMVEGASQYEIEITQNEKTVFKKVTSSPSWSGEIKPGSYSYRLRAFDSRKVPGPWSDFEQLNVSLSPVTLLSPNPEIIKIFSKSETDFEIELKWAPVSYAEDYRVFIQAGGENEIQETKVKGEASLQVALPVGGRYQWWVLPQNSTKNLSANLEEAQKAAFELYGAPLQTPEIEIPETQFIRQINWKSDQKTKNHLVKIFRLKTGNLGELVQTAEISERIFYVPLNWPGGRYQIQVTSQTDFFEDSKMSSKTFELIGGDRSEAAQYKAELRASIEGFKGWYSHASYSITEVDYLSRQRFSGGTVSTRFTTVAGTGKLGLGYLGSKKWGFLTLVDLSGMFNHQGNHVTFAGAESVAIYRTQISDRDEVRLKFGAYFRELPFAMIDPLGSRVDRYSNISMTGVITGGEYWLSISPKFAIQTHAYLYYGAFGRAPISSNSIQGSSQQYGVMGSYRLSKNRAGLWGLSYRQDGASFQTLDRAGNHIGRSNMDIRGMFLNFALEQKF